MNGKGLGSGGFILWPLFGTTNQLVGGLTLLVLIVHLKTRKRPVWPVAIPMVFLVLMTTVAGVMNLHGQITAETKNWPVIVFGALFLLLEALIFIEAIKETGNCLSFPDNDFSGRFQTHLVKKSAVFSRLPLKYKSITSRTAPSPPFLSDI